ncbi:MAG: NUDIX domain-containing protein, partial [Bacteroidota bacterium]
MLSKRLTDYAQPAGKEYLPNNSADCVIFGYHEKQLKILCTRVSGINGWLLPGGFIKKNEPLDDAANRVLIERTGLKGLFLKQFYTFGNTNRSWKKIHRNTLQKKIGAGSALPLNWMSDRYISTGYYALTEFSKVNAKPALIESECRWFDHDHLPGLLLDHSEMVKKAFVTLRLQIHHEPIGYNLLPEKFTLPEF